MWALTLIIAFIIISCSTDKATEGDFYGTINIFNSLDNAMILRYQLKKH